jgi:hypothetical protein
MRFEDHQGIPQSVFFCLPHKVWCRRTTIAVSDREQSHLTVRAENSITFPNFLQGKLYIGVMREPTTLNLFGNNPAFHCRIQVWQIEEPMTVISKNQAANLAEVLRGHQDMILEEWMRAMSASIRRSDLMKEAELRAQCSRFLKVVSAAVESGVSDLRSPAWENVREMLEEISRSRAQQGFSPSETAMFVFSLKRPLFERLRQEHERDPGMLASTLWSTTELVDGLGLYTGEVFIKAKESEIRRQHREPLALPDAASSVAQAFSIWT